MEWHAARHLHFGAFSAALNAATATSPPTYFRRAVFERYVDRVCADIENSPQIAAQVGGQMERDVDSIYLGGGTPTVLEPAQLERIFGAVRRQFGRKS